MWVQKVGCFWYPMCSCHLINMVWWRQPEDYLSLYFGKEMYLKAYTPIIYPVPSEEQWARTIQPIIEPSKARASSKRP
jgi:hypothetical protein